MKRKRREKSQRRKGNKKHNMDMEKKRGNGKIERRMN
jgi:hypothetical protein